VTEHELKRSADEYLAKTHLAKRTPRVNELAEMLHLTISKLSNWFLDEVGERPSEYLKRRHVLHAIDVIRSTNLDYETLAKVTGFRSRTTLFRAIRRITGKTPEYFRKGPIGSRTKRLNKRKRR